MQKRNFVNITRKAMRKRRPHPPLSHCLLQLKYTVQQIWAHLKKSTLSGDIRDDPKHPGMSWESSGSYLQKISRFAIQFNGGLGAARNFPISLVLLVTYWQFRVSLNFTIYPQAAN